MSKPKVFVNKELTQEEKTADLNKRIKKAQEAVRKIEQSLDISFIAQGKVGDLTVSLPILFVDVKK